MDGQGQARGLVVVAMGVPIGIPVDGAAADRLRRQWSRALTHLPAASTIDLAGLDGADPAAHDYAVTTRVTLAALEATAGRRVNVHAGAVVDDRGRALAVVGPSGAGKTTAVVRLARDLGYVSDETVSIDHRLGVHAHPKPLSVVVDPARPRGKDSVSPDDLGLAVAPTGVRLHRIVVLQRGDDDTGLEPLPAPRAIATIVEQTSSLVHLDHPMLRLAAAIEECGGVWALRYREFDDRADEVAALLDRAPQPPATFVHHPGAETGVEAGAGPGAEPGGSAGAAAGRWSRTPWKDAVEYVDEVVVMVDDQVRVLAGLGLGLWLALAEPRTLPELVAEARERWGEHPDAEALVAHALGVLAQQGVVRPPDGDRPPRG